MWVIQLNSVVSIAPGFSFKGVYTYHSIASSEVGTICIHNPIQWVTLIDQCMSLSNIHIDLLISYRGIIRFINVTGDHTEPKEYGKGKLFFD